MRGLASVDHIPKNKKSRVHPGGKDEKMNENERQELYLNEDGPCEEMGVLTDEEGDENVEDHA